jgi:hypothetical protein
MRFAFPPYELYAFTSQNMATKCDNGGQCPPYIITTHRSPYFFFTTRTGHLASPMTRSATEPMRSRFRPVRP